MYSIFIYSNFMMTTTWTERGLSVAEEKEGGLGKAQFTDYKSQLVKYKCV